MQIRNRGCRETALRRASGESGRQSASAPAHSRPFFPSGACARHIPHANRPQLAYYAKALGSEPASSLSLRLRVAVTSVPVVAGGGGISGQRVGRGGKRGLGGGGGGAAPREPLGLARRRRCCCRSRHRRQETQARDPEQRGDGRE